MPGWAASGFLLLPGFSVFCPVLPVSYPDDSHRNLVPPKRQSYRAAMADSIKISEFTDIKGAFRCEHKSTNNGNVEKGQALLCDKCSVQHASGAALVGAPTGFG